MIAITDLKVGSVVRLASGSPKFVVERIDPSTNTVIIIGWGEHVGIVGDTVRATSLVWPYPHDGHETATPPSSDD